MEEDKKLEENELAASDELLIMEEEEILEEDGGEDNPENKIKKLKTRLKECEKQKNEYLTGWQRAKADFINSRKDEEKLRERLASFQREHFLREFLSAADAFEIAFQDEGWEAVDEKWKKGVEAIFANFQKILVSYNVKPFESVGEKFEPEKHDALEAVEVAEAEKDQIILKELQKGYNIDDRVLRPAKVKVGVYKK